MTRRFVRVNSVSAVIQKADFVAMNALAANLAVVRYLVSARSKSE